MQRVALERKRYRTTDPNSQTDYSAYAEHKMSMMGVEERAAYERLRERLAESFPNFGIASADELIWKVVAFLNEKGVK